MKLFKSKVGKITDKICVQAKVDLDLYSRFRELKEIAGKSNRRLFEDYMLFYLENHKVNNRLDYLRSGFNG